MSQKRNPLQERPAGSNDNIRNTFRQAIAHANTQEYEDLVAIVRSGINGRAELAVPVKLVELERGTENYGSVDYVLQREGSRWSSQYTKKYGSGFEQFKTDLLKLAQDHFDEKSHRAQSNIMQGASSDDSSS